MSVPLKTLIGSVTLPSPDPDVDLWADPPTDPDLFAKPPEPLPNAVTARRCGNCLSELPPPDCTAAARAVGVTVLETLYDYLLEQTPPVPAPVAARIVQDIARRSGVTLL